MQKPFTEVAARYGLSTPNQVKQRIMWNNIKALVTHAFGKSPENDRLMARYESEWKEAEKEENQRT
jgi:hypothetical protein